MSRDNVEIVRRILDAINRGDVDAAIESASEDFEADWWNSRGLLSGIHRGRDEARESLKTFLEPWESLQCWRDLLTDGTARARLAGYFLFLILTFSVLESPSSQLAI
jgi:ketosteroid isomerase-like protein